MESQGKILGLKLRFLKNEGRVCYGGKKSETVTPDGFYVWEKHYLLDNKCQYKKIVLN